MLCRRSASLIITTRMSWAIAMIILRKFSACFSARLENAIFDTLVTPSTRRATSAPNRFSTSCRETAGVFHHVVQQRGHDRGNIELELGGNQRDVERMCDVGLAGLALLLAMHARGVIIGAADECQVGVGIVGDYPPCEFIDLMRRALGLG